MKGSKKRKKRRSKNNKNKENNGNQQIVRALDKLLQSLREHLSFAYPPAEKLRILEIYKIASALAQIVPLLDQDDQQNQEFLILFEHPSVSERFFHCFPVKVKLIDFVKHSIYATTNALNSPLN